VFFNFYGLGGLYEENRNQIPFVGVTNYQVTSPNIASLGLGYQYELAKNLYATTKINGAIYDFYVEDFTTIKKFITGGGLGLSYMSVLGPIDIYGAYSPEVNKFNLNINIGFYF
jgi:NTE family protein